MSKIYLIGLENDLFWVVLEQRRYVTKTMKQICKEGGGIEMSNYSAFPYTRMHRSLSLLYLLT